MQGSRTQHRATRTAAFTPIDGVSPYWKSRDAVLYLGESLQLLPLIPTATVAAVVTDPPYCSGGATTSERQRDPATKYCQDNHTCGRPSFGGDMRDQRSWKYWCTVWLTLCREATVEGGYCLVFVDWRQLPSLTDAIQAAGWAWHYKKYSDDPKLAALQIEAREAALGLWSHQNAIAPWEFREISSRPPPDKSKTGSPLATGGGKTHWLNTSGNVRHNSSCRWYGATKRGRYCGATEGRACGICGG